MAGLGAAAVLAMAVPAGAHVELDPGEAVAGSATTLTFSFHHGKDGTATTRLEVKLPDGASVVEIPPVDGWTSAVDDATGVVTWSGGRVADGVEAAFPVVVRLPDAPGVVLFPTIQTTEAGELAWIDEEEGESEDANPAPRLTLVADPDATTTTAVTPTTTEEPATTSTSRALPGTTVEAEERDDGDSNPAPWLIGSGLAAAAAIAGGGLWLRSRT
jgi:uncharacterized protein YcnI